MNNKLNHIRILISGFILFTLISLACIISTPEGTPTQTSMVTATTQLPPSTTVIPTDTPEPKPSDTPGPTNTPGASGCSDASQFIADITIPDNTSINSGEVFTKVWRFQNNGSCPWTQDYSFVFVEGDQMGAPSRVNLDQDVPPGGRLDISITFTAPTTSGTYQSTWQLGAQNGSIFGTRAWVQIIVEDNLVISSENVPPIPNELYIYYAGGGVVREICNDLASDSEDDNSLSIRLVSGHNTCKQYIEPFETIIIYGEGYEPNISIPFGVYFDPDGYEYDKKNDLSYLTGSLLFGTRVTTDSQGNFQLSLSNDIFNFEGKYILLPISQLEEQPKEGYGNIVIQR